MLNQYAVDNPTSTSQPALLPPYLGGMLSHFLKMLSRNDKQPEHLGHAWYIGKTFFAKPAASSSAPYQGGFNPWIFKTLRITDHSV